MGSVIGWGGDSAGQLAAGYKSSRVVSPIASYLAPANPELVQAPYTYSTFLAGGNVYAVGNNEIGELGNGSNHLSLNPVRVVLPTMTTHLASGAGHSLAVLANGEVWGWGGNGEGQLGNGQETGKAGQTSPVKAILPDNPIMAVAGGGSSAVIMEDGSLYVMGENKGGELGLGDKAKRLTPQRCPLPGVVDICVIGAVGSHGGYMVALLQDGTLWGCGHSGVGQLCGSAGMFLNPTKLVNPCVAPIAAMSASLTHLLILDTEGNAYSFGNNENQELGPRDSVGKVLIPEVTAIAAGLRSSAFVSKGLVYTCGIQTMLGRDGEESLAPIPDISQVTQVNAGENSMLAVTDGPVPVIELHADALLGGAHVWWKAPKTTQGWQVSWREHKRRGTKVKWSAPVKLTPTAKECTVSAMPAGVECEVQLLNHELGSHITTVTPK